MRVLCINGDFSNVSRTRDWFTFVKETPITLNNYTVIDVKEKSGRTGYILEEVDGGVLPNGELVTFDSARFVLVEDVTEEEMIREEEECMHLV